MATEINGESKDGSHIVGASNGPEDYFLWQKDEKFSGKDEVYFEWNDQSNGGCNLISECSINRDGIHVVLSDAQLVHFYFCDLAREQWEALREHLETMYSRNSTVLEFNY